MTRVKICGVRDAETAVAAAEAGADFIGIMFAESRRKVTPEQCHEIVEAIQGHRKFAGAAPIPGPARGEVSNRSWYGAWNEAIEEVLFHRRPLIAGVFAGQAAVDVLAIADAAGLDLVQLSGAEDDAYVRGMTLPVLRVVHVAAGMVAFDVLEKAPPGIGQAIMLDTASDTERGGTGLSFDWQVAREAGALAPVMVAGGLTPESVGAAIEACNPWAVDVSSGVETDGVKDIGRVNAFIKAAKGARV